MARKSWVQVNGELVPKEDYVVPSRLIIIPDIQPYKSMVTGETIHSRARHKAHLKQHGMVEIGNEKVKPKPIPDVPGLREDLARVVYGR